jgi:ABC-type phosphate transport system substrate-binding protein
MTPRTALLALALAAAAPAAAEDGFKVVVHPSNPADAISRTQLSQLFLKKSTHWPSGATVQPVEPADERLRSRFADRVHGRSLNAVKSYFNQLIFSGRDVPPLERNDDDEVVSYVRQNPGAVGYVSPAAATGGAKVVQLKD